MRLFAAVLPPDDVLDHLERALATVRGGASPGGRQEALRWTSPEDRHVTVAFYGEVPEGYLDDVAAALDDVAGGHTPFAALLRGAGLFDGRTLWVGCGGDGWGPLMADAGRVGEQVLGRPADRRSRAHLTVARAQGGGARRRAGVRSRPATGPGTVGGAAADPSALAHALALYTGPAWTVGEVALVASRLGAGPGGRPVHDVVHRWGLRAVAG